jgi:hypothetical protein
MALTIHKIYPVGNSLTNQSLVPNLDFINRFLSRNGDLLFYKQSFNAISDQTAFSLINCQGSRPTLCSTIKSNTSGPYTLALSLDRNIQAGDYSINLIINGNSQSLSLDNNYSTQVPINVNLNDQISLEINSNNNVWGYVVIYK